MTIYEKQWNYLQSAWLQRRIPQALLFVGSLDSALNELTQQLIQLIFCKERGENPCLKCIDCQMSALNEHPDIRWIKPEKNAGAIKIDQIRELQNDAYLTPQRAQYSLTIIESADKMNTSAANALLKILEEPAQHMLFLLLSHNLSTILPTVLSRCQIVRFASHDPCSANNFLMLGQHYPQESDQVMLIQQSEFILDGLIAVIKKKQHPCIVATQWMQFALTTLLWFLYLVYSQVHLMQINSLEISIGPAIRQLEELATLLSPRIIFAQIDKINRLQRQLSHHVNVNNLLVLEDLLFAL